MAEEAGFSQAVLCRARNGLEGMVSVCICGPPGREDGKSGHCRLDGAEVSLRGLIPASLAQVQVVEEVRRMERARWNAGVLPLG